MMTWTSGEVERQAASLEYIAENAELSESQTMLFAAGMLREYAGALAAQPPMTADRDAEIERVARAICAADNHAWPGDDYNGRFQRRAFEKQASAAIDAMPSAALRRRVEEMRRNRLEETEALRSRSRDLVMALEFAQNALTGVTHRDAVRALDHINSALSPLPRTSIHC